MRLGQQRKLERAVHLAAGVIVAAYIYLPLGDTVTGAIRWAVLPALVFSGLAMWQAARIRRAFRNRRSRVPSVA